MLIVLLNGDTDNNFAPHLVKIRTMNRFYFFFQKSMLQNSEVNIRTEIPTGCHKPGLMCSCSYFRSAVHSCLSTLFIYKFPLPPPFLRERDYCNLNVITFLKCSNIKTSN